MHQLETQWATPDEYGWSHLPEQWMARCTASTKTPGIRCSKMAYVRERPDTATRPLCVAHRRMAES